jgi:hypothetical protein
MHNIPVSKSLIIQMTLLFPVPFAQRNNPVTLKVKKQIKKHMN